MLGGWVLLMSFQRYPANLKSILKEEEDTEKPECAKKKTANAPSVRRSSFVPEDNDQCAAPS